MKHRADVDGLRAVAVASVVLYHAAPTVASRGYLGVDLFFVISGFLIARILRDDFAAGRFSLWRFYDRRVRRIIPALVVVCAATTAAASLLMFPDDLIAYAADLMSAAAFVANVQFYRSVSYFSAPADLKPLLHLWSLAVEEQFYILFPLIVWLGFRWNRLMSILVGLCAISLAAYLIVYPTNPSAVFFLLPFRAWELMLGAIAAVALPQWKPPRHLARAASWVGFSAIVYAMIWGADPIYPCLGAALILRLNTDSDLVAPLTWKPIVGLGLISYSLYLWHWPLFALARYYLMSKPDPMLAAVLVAISIGLAVLTWKFIELPFRQKRDNRAVFTLGGSALAGMLLVGAGLYASGGLPWRINAEARAMADYPARTNTAFLEALRDGDCFLNPEQDAAAFDKDRCLDKGGKPKSIVIWGDSYAAHYYPGLRKVFDGEPVQIMQATASACPPLVGFELKERPYCREINEAFLRLIGKARPDVVIVSSTWAGFDVAMLGRTINALNSLGTRVVVLGPGPVFTAHLPRILAQNIYAHRSIGRSSAVSNSVRETDRQMKRRYAKNENVTFISILDILCDEESCITATDQSVPIARDTGHLTPEGSEFVARRIKPQLMELLSQPATVTAPNAGQAARP